jgi:hypothetical protein
MILPNDYTPEELEIFNLITKRTYEPTHTAYIYQLIDDPINKFLLAWVFELGKTRRSAQIALGLSKATIWKRIKIIKKSVAKYAMDKHLIDKVDKI